MKSKEIADDLSESARDRKEDYGLGKGLSDFPGVWRLLNQPTDDIFICINKINIIHFISLRDATDSLLWNYINSKTVRYCDF